MPASSTLRENLLPVAIAELKQLYQTGKYMEAFERSKTLPPLEEWATTEGLVLAGRLASNWGDAARSDRLHLLAYRREPTNLEAIYFRAVTLLQKHGPFEALQFVRAQVAAQTEEITTTLHAYLWLLQSRLLGYFRDFTASEAALAKAELVCPEDPWLWTEKAYILERQDRYAESLVAAQRALVLRPWYRPAVEAAAYFLGLLNRDDEAVALLQQAMRFVQSASLAQHLATQLSERNLFSEALAAVDQAATWLPLADRNHRQWLAGRRADFLYRKGEYDAAREHARAANNGYHLHMAERLGLPDLAAKRVQLPVGYVRQHHMTCAPATLTAISSYWEVSVDHLELAKTICYDGTPDHEERYWAESHGWHVREFRVDWPTAVALLDRGCPFTLTTVAVRSAHLQAVIGYDAGLGTLLIRDPYHRTHGECIAEGFLQLHAAHGPRGMVLVPSAKAHLLDGIEFPDAALYDDWYHLRRALTKHDREAAERHAETLFRASPDHSISLSAKRELAAHDQNHGKFLEATRALLGLFPHETNFQLDEIQALQRLGRGNEAKTLIEQRSQARGAAPIFWRTYVEELRDDARHHSRARKIARRVLRRQAIDAQNLRTYANVLWANREFSEAGFLYRLAACAGDKNEYHWDAYFSASRHLQKTEESLELLRTRLQQLGPFSGQPARTLFTAYEALDRGTDAFEVLSNAVALRPDDGELLLFAAEAHGRYGQSERAQELLSLAETRSPRASWLRVAARIHSFLTQHEASLARWQELLTFNPTDLDAHQAIARLLAIVKGRPAALAHLESACLAFPHHLPLHTLRLEWLRKESAEACLAVAETMLALDSTHAWALREKALILRRLQRLKEARECAEEALRIEPYAPASHGVLGTIALAEGESVRAREEFKRGLALSIDAEWLVSDLLRACGDFETRREAIAFVEEELSRQTSLGETYLRFRDVARTILSPEELGRALQKLLDKHPGHWAAWSALGNHLLDRGETAAALEKLTEATRRFPLVPRLHVDLASAHARAGRSDEEAVCLRRALELNPSWGHASRQLALVHERALLLDQAEHVMRRAVAANPLEAANQVCLAEILWRRNSKKEAILSIEHALHLDPNHDWGWQLLHRWSVATGEPQRLKELIETFTRERGGEASSWLRLARFADANDLPARLQAIDRALELEPRNIEAHDLRAELLAASHRYDEAIVACGPSIFGSGTPHQLLGRAAWIEYLRGQGARAIAQMKELLNKHPDYTWGWACLTEWHWRGEQFAEASEAATKWSWLNPEASSAHGYIAAAQIRLGNKYAAKDALLRALHIEPTYVFGAQRLLKLHTDDREQEAAAKTLEHIRVHLAPPEARLAEVRFHVMRKDRDAARTALAALADAPREYTGVLQEAAGIVFEAGWPKEVEHAFEGLLSKSDVNPEIGTLWVEAWGGRQKWGKLQRVGKRSLPQSMEIKIHTAAVEALGKAKERWRLRWLRWRKGKWLRGHIECWGAMGYALTNCELTREAVSWLKDADTRADAQPWMLYNFAHCLYILKHSARAEKIVELALKKPADHTRGAFLVWRAAEQILRGEAEAARATLDHVGSAKIGAATVTLKQFVAALLEFEKDKNLAKAKAALRTARKGYPPSRSDPALVHFYCRCLRKLATSAGAPLTRLQSYLPSFNYQTSAPKKSGSSSINGLGALWFTVVLLSVLVRNCSGH